MSSTKQGNLRSGTRSSNKEDMMWQGVRPKAPPVMKDDSITKDPQPQSRHAPIQGRQQSLQSTGHPVHLAANDEAQAFSVMAGMSKEEPNFPLPINAYKHQSQLQPQTMYANQFNTIMNSDDSIHDRRSQYTTESRRSSNTNNRHHTMKKVDYSEISKAMVQQQQQSSKVKNNRGAPLKASRFISDNNDPMMQSLPVDPNSNARFGPIDVNFKRQIDQLKQNRAQSMLPVSLDNETPLRGKVPGNHLQHNDSIYQSSVNHSMNSGLGLTPKRLQTIDNPQGNGRKAAPFGNQTEQKAYANRVPPILLANENKMKYVGHKHQTQALNQPDFASPSNTQSHQQYSPNQRHEVVNGASFLSREAGSTAYSQPEDSMFMPSVESVSQQRNRFPPHVLPKIGSANPEINNRFKQATAYPDRRNRDVSAEHDLRGRQLSTAQPKDGFKFSKGHVQSQQQRSRQTSNHLNDTGFNWKQVDIKTDKNFDGTHRLGSTSVKVPAAYRRPKKMSPGQLLNAMQQVDHRGPIQHKVVSSQEFERLAQRQKSRDGGVPMVEKTIFIVKPIYVPVEVPTAKTETHYSSIGPQSHKTKIKIKKQMQKSIYMERPKPPNYMSNNATALIDPRLKKQTLKNKRRATQQMNNSRSPSPFTNPGETQLAEALNQSSVDQVNPSHTYSSLQAKGGAISSDQVSKTTSKTTKDLKHLVESSTIIDQIFARRTAQVEAGKKAEEERKLQEEREYQEVLEANMSLKASLTGGGGSFKSKMSLQQQMSGSKNGEEDQSSPGKKKKKKPVDTTKEFISTINDQLHTAGAGIQIIMEESKDARWFSKKAADEKKANKQYGKVRKWQIAPKTFEQTELNAEELSMATHAAKLGRSRAAMESAAGLGVETGAKSINTRSSIPKFANSPSGGNFSERRWRSPTQARSSIGNESNRSETKSPFTARSGRGSQANRGSQEKVIFTEDQGNANQLSIERVAAMKLLTKKLSKVAKVPITMENHFCSHIDPTTSANLIAADELARLDPHHKFHNRWKDKEHRDLHSDALKAVPKNFYNNFKTNLVRDAHYMASAIKAHRSQSPIERGNNCLNHDHGDASVNCGCKSKKKKTDLSRRFRSYIGGIKSKSRSKNVVKNAYNLHKPYRPCRRTCCGNHNPLFHGQRMHEEHLKRMHASATKLMIMSIVPERPISADSATRALREYQKDIDYFSTIMHDTAKELKQKMAQRKLKSREKRAGRDIEGINEVGEGEEEDARATPDLLGLNLAGSIGKLTQSNMNIMQEKLNGSLDEQRSLTAIEAKYLLSVLKNRSVQANQIKDKQFDGIYAKARTTLKIQMKKLLLKKQFHIIDRQYKLAENEKQTSQNLIKILSRCLRMFDAQASLLKIINLIESRLEKLKEFKVEQQSQEPRPDAMKKLYVELFRVSGRIHAEIRILKTLERSLDRPFMFCGEMYDSDFMHQQMKRKRLQILGQMPELADCNELKMFLLENGEMTDVRKCKPEDFELKQHEPLWSESSEGESEDQDEFNDINRLNDNSQERLSGVGVGRKLMR